MKLVTKVNIVAATAIVIAAAVVIGVNLSGASSTPTPSASAAPSAADASSHRLNTANADALEFVEFLDFECEVCAAVHPTIEELRAEYGNRLSFVVRYFPIPAHQNSMNAALAVEAAAQQDAFEAMYKKMFDTQSEWGEQQDSKAGVFREYAAELGLDLARYDVDVAADTTRERVELDFDAGRALGVDGTPTFFLDNQKLTITSLDELRGVLSGAVD